MLTTNMHINKKILLLLVTATLIVWGASLVLAQSSTTQAPIGVRVAELQTKYDLLKIQEARKDAQILLTEFVGFCQTSSIECSIEIKNVEIGIRGATKVALVRIVQEAWLTIEKKAAEKISGSQPAAKRSEKRSKSKILEQTLRNNLAQQAPKLVEYAGINVPENLATLYKTTSFKETVKDTTEKLGSMVLTGNITDTQVENALRGVFSTATTDTAVFAANLMDKYNLKNVATIILKDPKNTKAIKEMVGQEIQKYAEQEINKLANQAIGTIFPALQGIEFDFANLNSKTLKSTLRSAIVNAMAQSYLGPQYVAVYLAVSTVCPSCMEKTHAELRRFDKNYIQPATEKIGDEWDRFEDRVKAESARVGKQISAELDRLSNRISTELERQRKQVEAQAQRAKEQFQDELKRAQDSRIGKEIERQLNDISNGASRGIDKAQAELQRELNDVVKEADRHGKRVAAEIGRQVADAQVQIKRLGTSAKSELQREVKSVTNEAQRVKERVEAELKRAADRVEAEAKRAAEKAQAELDRLKAKAKKYKKKLRL